MKSSTCYILSDTKDPATIQAEQLGPFNNSCENSTAYNTISKVNSAPFTFWLGTHDPLWLSSPTFANIPLFVSRVRLHRLGKRWPRALTTWALDSGGFSEIKANGRWTITAAAYAAEVRRCKEEIGGLQWAAIQDWMCESKMLDKTGLSVSVHQALTTKSYLDLSSIASDLPWIPILQGFKPDDYLRHIDSYTRAGIDLKAAPVVGVGSVCRRQAGKEAAEIMRRLSSEGLRLHGFGFKLQGVQRAHQYMISSDSLAWSRGSRGRNGFAVPCPVYPRKNCANCDHAALEWRKQLVSIYS